MEINQLNVYNELKIADLVGDTKRTVIACTKLADYDPGDSYARWITICHKHDEYHQFVVWDVIARPEGFYAGSGDYVFNLQDAVDRYQKRGGQ